MGGAGTALALFIGLVGATVIWLAVTADDALDLIRSEAIGAIPVAVVDLPARPGAEPADSEPPLVPADPQPAAHELPHPPETVPPAHEATAAEPPEAAPADPPPVDPVPVDHTAAEPAPAEPPPADHVAAEPPEHGEPAAAEAATPPEATPEATHEQPPERVVLTPPEPPAEPHPPTPVPDAPADPPQPVDLAAAEPPEPAETTVIDPRGGHTGPQVETALTLPEPPAVEVAPPDLAMPPAPGVAWRANARPFDRSDQRPWIAIVLTDLGQLQSGTETAIQRLPGAVTLAFAPYASNLDAWVPQARAAGHEVLLMVPMEPQDYPQNDPGPHTLLVDLPTAENRARLNWVLGRADGIVGVISEMGGRFARFAPALRPMIAQLGETGLLVVDGGATVLSAIDTVAAELGVPHATANRVIDDVLSRDAIDGRLAELESIALAEGMAVGVARPYPVVLERLSDWFPRLRDRGFALVPITAIAAGRPAP
ncbi:MAG: divergent polysaccharide deacetylase family protein [Rhodospirillaceae bacterium]|nr:divergent polysaccharide deacetylase family protein [Rhodospirillaceae bacterium]